MQTFEKVQNGIKVIVRYPDSKEVPEKTKQEILDQLYTILAPKAQSIISET